MPTICGEGSSYPKPFCRAVVERSGETAFRAQFRSESGVALHFPPHHKERVDRSPLI
jgi:hypothetical protein